MLTERTNQLLYRPTPSIFQQFIIAITNIIIIYLPPIHHISIHLFSCWFVAELNSMELVTDIKRAQ
jgi:hypothetical protein